MSDAAPVPPDLLAHSAFVRRLARSLLAGTDGAEDVVQETWRRGLERPPRHGELRAWLARVTRNLAFQRRRADAHRRERERGAARAEALPAADAGLERTETLQRVVDAVRALEEPYRATILARFFEDLPARAIAERDGVSVETVHTRLRRAQAQLRERLERGTGDWRPALGLLAGESPRLPPAQLQVLAAVAAATTLAWGLWRVVEPGEPRSESAVALRGAPSASTPTALASVGASVSRRMTVPTPAVLELAGRVIDEQGAPVEGAEVCVLGHLDPFGPLDTNPPLTWNLFHGRVFSTDVEGRWRAQLPAEVPPEQADCRDCHTGEVEALPEPGRVFVALRHGENYEPSTEQGGQRWVSVPASDVDFVVRRIPTGTVEIRVVEGVHHVPLEDFRVALHGGFEPSPDGGVVYHHGFRSERASGPDLRCEWRVEDPDGVSLHVILSEPDVGNLWSKLLGKPERLEQEIHLSPGETEQVLFVLPERGVLRGQVVDPDGAPVADASVFFGPEARARGDEPFKPFRPERVTDGARTAADGWFELRGDGAEVTAGHADFSAVSVRATSASRIVLGARGAIRGRVVARDGRPAAGLGLLLDQREGGPTTTTDASGAFAFEHVEQGAHAVWTERDWPLACVRLEAGEELELELGLADERTLALELSAVEPGELEEVRGVVVGLGQVFDLCEVAAGVEPGTLSVQEVPRPGAYWLATSVGVSAPFVIREGEERVALTPGSAALVVRGSVRSVQVVPADADPFLRLIAARVRVKIDAERGARFRLAPGRYLLVGEAGVALREVELPPEGLELTLQ